MRNIVLTSPAAESRTRAALSRALERFPADAIEVDLQSRASRLRELAAGDDVELIAVVDDDALLAPDAFGALRRAFGARTVLAGGRAIVGAVQRLGGMFGPSRSGPNPFEIVPLAVAQADKRFAELVRGPVDIPQRGAIVVSAAFVRSLPEDAGLDGLLLHLDLAVYARALGAETVCEPQLTFTAGEDPPAMLRKLSNLRHYAAIGTWKPEELHRDPVRVRAQTVTREVRVMGNIRGYARRAYPPIDVLVVTDDAMGRARAQKNAAALAVGGTVTVCGAADGDVLRSALAHTSDRYLLLIAGPFPERAAVEVLAERLERSGRVAVAFDRSAPPFDLALFHCGRIESAGALGGESVAEVVASLIERLPKRRLFGAGPDGEMVPSRLPVLTGLPTLDVVFVAASKPALSQQTLQALLGESIRGRIAVVYPAGSATTERLFAVHSVLELMPDDSDVQLAVGLNRALGSMRADGILILRDDAQIPRGMVERLQDAFRRMPRLGIAVPRVGGADRPESLPDLGYRNLAEMQALYERRAEAYAREASLLEVATAPVMLVRRDVLEVVGGFDEAFGFSRLGVEDFSRRVRAANFLVACCDDAYAHLFGTEEAASFVANLDAAPFLRESYEKRWAHPHGFDPASDYVPLRTDAATPADPAVAPQVLRILLPLRDEAEWSAARPLLAELAAAFRVHDPIQVAVGLDGTFGLQTALRELRELLLACGVPMEDTLNVSIDFVPNVAEWRDAVTNSVRFANSDRDELRELSAIDGVAAARLLLVPSA